MSDKMISGKMTRRQVLSRATAVGLTRLAAPYVIPSGVLARAGMTGANDRIVVAGIGVRRMGGALIRQGFARFEDAYRIEIEEWCREVRQGMVDDGTFSGPSVWDGYAAQVVARAGEVAILSGSPADVALPEKPSLYGSR